MKVTRAIARLHNNAAVCRVVPGRSTEGLGFSAPSATADVGQNIVPDVTQFTAGLPGVV
jgi:hypothetical protein